MQNELYYLMQLLGGGQGLLQVAFLAGLLLIPVFKPERIHKPGLFKVACLLFAISIMAPSAISLIFSSIPGFPGFPSGALG